MFKSSDPDAQFQSGMKSLTVSIEKKKEFKFDPPLTLTYYLFHASVIFNFYTQYIDSNFEFGSSIRILDSIRTLKKTNKKQPFPDRRL